ncbi:hypothetical protein B0H15DRAFT_797835 [Mycena belliarum]|uniref:Uncharacterized protein n=1 Tax=Mycena belliarum TaxID=1033014 RepID=A0AAD6UDW9_9AGAR|nr:hypothetical protein B0H15DRAFT_797835 [Mycena belliae]
MANTGPATPPATPHVTPPGPSVLSDMTNLPLPDALAIATAELAKSKADLETTQSLLNGLTRKSRKRKRKRNAIADDAESSDAPARNKVKTTPAEHTQDFFTHGRKIMRFIGPFENIHSIITHGLKMDTALFGDEPDEGPLELRMSESWRIIYQKFPGFHDLMLSIHKDLPLIEDISNQMASGMDNARSDDTGTLKPRILGLLEKTLSPDATVTLTTGSSKDGRGSAHPIVAPLLLPLEYTDKEEYPDPWTLIAAGELDINGKQFPCFLFPFGQVDDYTALETILTGPILLRSAKALLMGPASALKGDGWHRGKAGNASLIGLLTFTGRLIAYIACQVRFNLSSQQDWNKLDGHFDYEEFFWCLVGLFDDEQYGSKTIALYNRVVLGHAAGVAPAAGAVTSSIDVSSMTHLERLKAARTVAQAKASAAVAAAAAATC